MSDGLPSEAQLALTNPTSAIGEVEVAGHPLRLIAKIALHVGLVVGALWMFVIALQLIKSGAVGKLVNYYAQSVLDSRDKK